jgi:hypothetical protein
VPFVFPAGICAHSIDGAAVFRIQKDPGSLGFARDDTKKGKQKNKTTIKTKKAEQKTKRSVALW